MLATQVRPCFDYFKHVLRLEVILVNVIDFVNILVKGVYKRQSRELDPPLEIRKK